jgi:hypothetical protein
MRVELGLGLFQGGLEAEGVDRRISGLEAVRGSRGYGAE